MPGGDSTGPAGQGTGTGEAAKVKNCVDEKIINIQGLALSRAQS